MSARPDLTTEELIRWCEEMARTEAAMSTGCKPSSKGYYARRADTLRAIAQRLRSERPAPCTFKAFGKFPCELPEGHDGDHIWRALREMRENLMHDYPSERPAVTPEMVEAARKVLDRYRPGTGYYGDAIREALDAALSVSGAIPGDCGEPDFGDGYRSTEGKP